VLGNAMLPRCPAENLGYADIKGRGLGSRT
jgi:hypothetical protein